MLSILFFNSFIAGIIFFESVFKSPVPIKFIAASWDSVNDELYKSVIIYTLVGSFFSDSLKDSYS